MNMTVLVNMIKQFNAIAVLNNYTIQGPFTYSSMYHTKGKRSSYSCIKNFNNNYGIYIFTDLNDNIIYVGEASTQTIYIRIQNHFSNITGSLLKKATLPVLLKSQIYLLIDNSSKINKQKILFDEALLIGICRPKYNF